VRPATNVSNPPLRVEGDALVTRVTVTLKIAFEVAQELLRAVPGMTGREVVTDVRVIVVADITPNRMPLNNAYVLTQGNRLYSPSSLFCGCPIGSGGIWKLMEENHV
jgi:hypothetical protein